MTLLFVIAGFAACVGGYLLFAYLKTRLYGRPVYRAWCNVAANSGLERGESGDVYTPTLHGELEGVEVDVRVQTERRSPMTGGRGESLWSVLNNRPRNVTVFEAELPDSVPTSIHLEGRERIVSRPTGPRVASPGFEECFDVAGGSREVDRFRRHEGAVEALFELYDHESRLEWKGSTLRIRVSGRVGDEESLREGLETIAETARRLGESFRDGEQKT